LLIIILSIINYFGVKHSAQFSSILIAINISILLIFGLIGLFFIKMSNFKPFFPHGITGMLTASSFIFFAYTGFARVTMLGEEIEEPRKTIPRAIISSIAISAAVYMLVMIALIGIVPYDNIANSESPLAYGIYYATKSPLASYIIAIGAMIATINVDLTMILGLSRVVFAMSRDQDLPKSLAKINKYGAPSRAIVFSSFVMIIAIFTIDFKNIIAFSNAAALTSYAIANLAALKLSLLNKNKKEKMLFKSNYFFIIPILGFLLTLTMLSFLTRFSIMLNFWVLIIITIYYVFVRAERERHGMPLTMYKKLPKKKNW
jgi:APA family basic amino acid/polyamine antiporter